MTSVTVRTLDGTTLCDGMIIDSNASIVESLQREFWSSKSELIEDVFLLDTYKLLPWDTPSLLRRDSLDLTLVRSTRPRIFSTSNAFCVLSSSGRVCFWGDPRGLGDADAARTMLKNITVIDVTTNRCAFAALTSTGSVVSWGEPNFGGDTGVSYDANYNVHKLNDFLVRSNVIKICSTYYAFLAVRDDGQVFSWGYAVFGANNSSVHAFLANKKVVDASAGVGAFAAFLDDFSVVFWDGHKPFVHIENVESVYHQKGPHTNEAMILRRDGTITSIEEEARINILNDCRHKPDKLTKYTEVIPGMYAFVGITKDGRVRCWGEEHLGGKWPEEASDVELFVKIINCWGAFAGLRADGTVFVWGKKEDGIDSFPRNLNNVVDIMSSDGAHGFAALTQSGSLVAWGDESVHEGSGMKRINWPPYAIADVERVSCGGEGTFYAVRKCGDIIAWGPNEMDPNYMAGWEIDFRAKRAIREHGGAVYVVPTKWANCCAVEGAACCCRDNFIVSWGTPTIVNPDEPFIVNGHID